MESTKLQRDILRWEYENETKDMYSPPSPIEWLENKLIELRKHDVMGSLVKPLNWIDNPKKRSGDIYKVMSRADVPMPHTVGNACIEITEQTYPHKYYEAKLLCFNRGTYIAEGNSVDEAKSNAFKWWSDFVCGFLYCHNGRG